MNLIINIVYLVIFLVYAKKYSVNYSDSLIMNNLVLIGLILVANIIYRIIVNIYLKKSAVIKDVLIQSIKRTLIIIAGIILLNYTAINPQILAKYNIPININNIDNQYVIALLSLIPYFLYKVTSCMLFEDI